MLATHELLAEFQQFALKELNDKQRVAYIDELFHEWYEAKENAATLEAIEEARQGGGRPIDEVNAELAERFGLNVPCRTK